MGGKTLVRNFLYKISIKNVKLSNGKKQKVLLSFV